MKANEVSSAPHLASAHGTHLLGEWYECASSTVLFDDAESLRRMCLFVTASAGLQIVGDAFHQFEPQGVTGTVLLAESHLAIHTWPEAKFVTIDVYVCNYLADNTSKAHELYNGLKAYFKPVRETFARVLRGRQHD